MVPVLLSLAGSGTTVQPICQPTEGLCRPQEDGHEGAVGVWNRFLDIK